MWILYWLINSFLSSIQIINFKKSLEINKTSSVFFALIGTFCSLFFTLIFLIFGFADFKLFLSTYFFILILINITWIISTHFDQKIYKEEKLSVLAPYWNLNLIFLTILSYIIFLFNPYLTSFYTSTTSFFVALVAIIITTIFSIDFKNIWIPKNIWIILISKFLTTTRSILTGFFLVKISSFDFFVLNNISYFIITIIILIYKKEFFQFNKLNKEFITHRSISGFLWGLIFIIWLYLIQNLWLILSSLIWFFSLATTLIFSYVFLKDIPTKKNILAAILVSICTIIWVIYK